jgi:hypothetical protein
VAAVRARVVIGTEAFTADAPADAAIIEVLANRAQTRSKVTTSGPGVRPAATASTGAANATPGSAAPVPVKTSRAGHGQPAGRERSP